MRQSTIFALSMIGGAAVLPAVADGNLALAALMGATLGCAVAVMIVAFPLDLSYREPLRGKREVHVVMVNPDKTK